MRQFIKKAINYLKRIKGKWSLIKIEYRHVFPYKGAISKSISENILQNDLDGEAELQEVKAIDISQLDSADYKWCGGVRDSRYFYAIPNSAHSILKIDLNTGVHNIIKIPFSQERGWTGGAIYRNVLYGFTRSANCMLTMDIKKEIVEMLPLDTKYSGEHHYGGVVTENGILYQPPRSTNHILKIDLNTKICEKIYIDNVNRKVTYRYTTGVIHKNGLIYFFPEHGEKVMVLRLKDEKIYFIGKRLDAMVFGGIIALDNNIYGFSAYEKGILYIDTQKNTTRMIHTEIGIPGCYGTKIGRNGRIYGIPGTGDWIWEYDYLRDMVTKKLKLPDTLKGCKYAGAVVSDEGDIWCVPVGGGYLSILCFTKKRQINQKIIKECLDNNQGNY